jgi:1-acyl-sn-glycerol-3-phosphate acyltransferase
MRASWRFRASRWLLLRLMLALFRLRVEGLERLPPKGPYLVACNHLGWVDPFVLVACLPANPQIRFLGRREAVENRWFKRVIMWFLDVVIPVDRGHHPTGRARI